MGHLMSQGLSAVSRPLICEINQAIADLPSGKATEYEAVPLEFYKVFMKIILPPFVQGIQNIWTSGEDAPSWNTTRIIVFLKNGKPSEELGSDRSISFINADAKIVAKVLAAGLASLMSGLVLYYQHGFIPGRNTMAHVDNAIVAFDIAEKAGFNMGMILLDAEKVFDCVVWKSLSVTMAAFNFGCSFLKWLQAFYKSP
ncbi:hypothetical protein NDU88_005406 [Pleurodeles waltl]|uniref:Reverse transcriptase domain-containing protein n=1 Tax=Pleurodeles waltl TaxID=8319 RepID=A0AAV7SLS5_PLEWA|nr:hypothetical protein NDU88_005406 [Pleurodeles waltl]